jgi:hypothetical protein
MEQREPLPPVVGWVRYAAVALLAAVALSQVWSLRPMWQPSTVISHFAFDADKCALSSSAPDLTLRVARESDSAADSLLTVAGKQIRISVQHHAPTEALFEAQRDALRRALDCGTSAWCEGKAPDSAYGAAQLALLDQKRRGGDVVLPGCEITDSDFHPESFEIIAPVRRRFDALAALSILVDLVAIFLLLRGQRKPWLRKT